MRRLGAGAVQNAALAQQRREGVAARPRQIDVERVGLEVERVDAVPRAIERAHDQRVDDGGERPTDPSLRGGDLRGLADRRCVEIERGEELISPVTPETVLHGGDLLTFVGKVDDGGNTVEGRAQLFVTVQRFVDPPIR